MVEKQTAPTKRGFPWFPVLVTIIIVYFSTVLISQQVRLNQVERDQIASDYRLETARQENEALLREKEKLGDLEQIERIAREELGMTKPGEVPYTTLKH